MPGISMISMLKKKQKINGPIIDVVSQGTKYTSGTQFFQYRYRSTWNSSRIDIYLFPIHFKGMFPSAQVPSSRPHSPAAVPLNDWSFGSSCCPPNPRRWRRLWPPPRVRAPRAERPGRARSGWTWLDSGLEGFMDFRWFYWEISSYNMLCIFTMEEYTGIQWNFLYFCDNITTCIKMITWSVSMYGIKTSTLREDYMFDTLWLFNIAMENGSCLDDSPIQHGDLPVRYLK